MEKILLSSFFLFLSSVIFAGSDFTCSKMNNKNFLSYGAIYGTFYAMGYNDAINKKIDKEFEKIMKKIAEYIREGCEKYPTSNIVNLFRRGIKSGYVKSDFKRKEIKNTNIDKILYKLSGGADKDTRECVKINLTEDLVKIIELKFDKLEKVCGKNCKKYKRKDLRKIFNKSEGTKFDKEFKLAFKKCKL